MREYKILDLIAETADIIADYHGMNVPYCESMDMSLFHQPIYAMLDDEEPDLGDLQFLAANNRLLPKSLKEATMEEFRAYCKEHRDEILDEIEADCKEYQDAYGDYDEDEDDGDEPTYLGGKKWDELSEHDKGVVADLEF